MYAAPESFGATMSTDAPAERTAPSRPHPIVRAPTAQTTAELRKRNRLQVESRANFGEDDRMRRVEQVELLHARHVLDRLVLDAGRAFDRRVDGARCREILRRDLHHAAR